MNSGSHSSLSCEYGATATKEGLANFLAARSLTTHDTEVWGCSCDEDASAGDDQDVCSKLAAFSLSSGDPDRIDFSCTSGRFYGVGDRYSDSPATCAQIQKAQGCDCVNSTCEDSVRLTTGWQNQEQVNRFLWDVVDTNNENGADNTDENIITLIAALEGMPCSETQLNVDGTCNEPNRQISGGAWFCNPVSDSATSPAPHGGTRHSYNVFDFGSVIPGDQTDERVLNCVQGATD
jgi:hypothetical protein